MSFRDSHRANRVTRRSHDGRCGGSDWTGAIASGTVLIVVEIDHSLSFIRLALLSRIMSRIVASQKSRTFRQSAESPILFRSHGHETPLSDQNGASKIGDSVLCFQASVECRVKIVDKRVTTKAMFWERNCLIIVRTRRTYVREK